MLFETMLFCGSTKLFADHQVQKFVLKSLTPDTLIQLISEGFLSVHFVESMLLMKTSSDSLGRRFYDPDYITVREYPFSRVIREACADAIGKVGQGRRLVTMERPAPDS
jgi:hypothetical protein